MKKLYFSSVTCLLFLAFTSSAQIKKGSLFLGGNLGGSTQTSKSNGATTNKQNGLTVSPVIGKAVSDNLIFGVDVSFGIFKSDNTGINQNQKQQNYGAGFFLRKYKPLGKSGFLLFLQGDMGYGYSNFETNGQQPYFNRTKRHSVGISGYPGISYAVNKKLHIETGFNNLVGINYFTEKRIDGGIIVNTTRTNGFSVNTSLNNLSNLYVGFRLLLSK